MQRYIVIVPAQDGGMYSHPMKQWLRENDSVLPGSDPTSLTSHQLRRLLIQKGWKMESNAEEVRLIAPSATSSQIEKHHAVFDAETEILAKKNRKMLRMN